MIRTRTLTAAEAKRDVGNGYHVKLRSPQRGTLVGVRLQPGDLAKIDALVKPGQSRADVIRRLITNL